MTLKQSLLWPFTLPYGAAAHLRARAYRKGILKSQHLDGVVISVGNLTTGGTGKTPMVLWIAERLLAEGKQVGILTRGYRGQNIAKPSGTNPPIAATNASVTTSDEVRLLQSRLGNRVQFGVGANRYAAGGDLARCGVNWFVLDDGFQHLQLARDVDIVLIDATNPFSGGRLLPAGHLREPRSALARADIIVITRSAHAPAIESAIRRDSAAPIFYARPKLDAIHSFTEGQVAGAVAPEALPKLFAFCGIGNPTAFLDDLRTWGLDIVGHKFFPDHHRYTDNDDEEILQQAGEAGASGLICTEKDLYNLHAIYYGKLPTFYCAISMRIDNADDFWRTVLSTAESLRTLPVQS
ncbi:MAG TPA: tetraacyldisaccharide 4'-kinase [Candidatus Acidoferrales bacterium]